MCKCKVGPGKFEGEPALAFLAWQSMLLGCVDATTGDEGNTVDWFRAPFNFDADHETVDAAKAYGYCDECIAVALESDAAGLALREDSQGFVHCEEFATREEFDRALAEAVAADESEAEE